MSAAPSHAASPTIGPSTHELTIDGTRFLLDGQPFPFQGVSFFNAIYNESFNRDADARVAWLRKFKRYGINLLRVWCQWDIRAGFVDTRPDATMYEPDGRLRGPALARLKQIIEASD